MERYGIYNTTINWVRNFRTDRKQKVSVNGAQSIRLSHDVTSRIPQGSVLEPILFVIYINDMPDHVDSEAYIFCGRHKSL